MTSTYSFLFMIISAIFTEYGDGQGVTLMSSDVGPISIDENPLEANLTAVDQEYSGNLTFSITVSYANDNNTIVLGNISSREDVYTTSLLVGPGGYILDRELQNAFMIEVQATNANSVAASVTIQVILLDVNDNPPFFSTFTYMATLPENVMPGVVVVMLAATDSDAIGINSEIRFSLITMTDTFTVTPTTGEISLVESLDYEAVQFYNLSVIAVDLGFPMLASAASVVVTVTDINDNPPLFLQYNYTVQVPENLLMDSQILQVSAYDGDRGIDDDIIYTILSGSHSDHFTINSSTGNLSLQLSLDHEFTVSYLLTVTASEVMDPTRQNSTTVEITVIDINDNIPLFIHSPPYANITEDTEIGVEILTVTAIDADEGINDQITYSINGTVPFIVNMSTGVIIVASVLDYELTPFYTFEVEASDSLFSSFILVQVDIIEVNECPIFNQLLYHANVSEGILFHNYVVVTVSATDEDEGINGQVSYSINDTVPFTLFESTGTVTVTSTLDYETVSFYTFMVWASDQSCSSSTTVEVDVLDINDNTPRFEDFTNVVNVSEDTSPDTIITTVTATDADSGLNGEIEYSILMYMFVSNDTVEINPVTGEITILVPLDYETLSSFSLLIAAEDSPLMLNLRRTTVVLLTVDIIDVNDLDPQFGEFNNTIVIFEGLSVGSELIQVSAYDGDRGIDDDIIYTLSGPGSGMFLLDASGKISLAATLDREDTSHYQLTITASEVMSPTSLSSTTVEIIVLDVNDNCPTFLQQQYNVSINATDPLDGVVLTVQAVDPDEAEHAELMYSIRDVVPFSVDVATGAIIAHTILSQRSYTFQVWVDDVGGMSCGSVATVQIDVTNVPFIQPNALQITILEGDTVRFNCIPSPRDLPIIWSYNVTMVSDAQQTSFSPPNLNHTLTINDVTVPNTGVYTCQLLEIIFFVQPSEILLNVLQACQSNYSMGILWPRQTSNTLARVRCSLLHSSFRSGVDITRMCYSNGEWADVDMSACTMRSDARPLVMMETDNGGDVTLIVSEITNILSENSYMLSTSSSQSFSSFNTLVILVTISDDTISDNVTSVILEDVSFNVSFVTVFIPAFQCSCNQSLSLNNSVNYICIGPSVSPCVKTIDGRYECNTPTYTGNEVRCGLDSDSDGYPDVQLGCIEPQCEMDVCPLIYNSDGNTDEPCTLDQQSDAVCRSENDTTWGIEWPTVPVGSVATQKCPGLAESSGLASRNCLQNGQYDDNIDVTQCRNMELVSLNDRAIQSAEILRNNTNNDTMDLTVIFDINEVQIISEELTILTNTSGRPLVPNDLNTSNSVLSSLISVMSIASREIMENTTAENLEPVLQNISSTIDNMLETSNMISYEEAGNMQLSVGEDLLQNTENFAIAVGDVLTTAISTNATNETSRTIERQNIVLNAQLPPVEKELINDIVFPPVGDTQVTIPAGAIIHQRNVEGTRATIVNFIADNLQQYLQDESPRESSRDDDKFAGSKIISSQISIGFIQLPTNSTVLLKFNEFMNGSRLAIFQCVFWDFELTNLNNQTVGGWSTEGIIQDSSPGLPVLCNTTHLTSFTVLVSSEKGQGSLSLRIVSYIGCGISIVCLIVTITTIIVWRKKAFSGKHYLVHLNLSIALLLGLIAFVSAVETAKNNRPGCIFVTTLLHYLFLAVFSWSLCEGMMVFAMFVKPFYKGFFQQMLFYLIVGWGLPIPIVVISAGVSHDHYGLYDDNKRWACWISDDDGAIWAFTAPMIVIIIINSFFLAASLLEIYNARKHLHKMTGTRKHNYYDAARTILIGTLALLPLLGGTWIMGLLFLFDSDSEAISWIFTVLNSLQGLFIFFFHVLRNREVVKYCKSLWKRMKKKNPTTSLSKDDLLNNYVLKPSPGFKSATDAGSGLNYQTDDQLHCSQEASFF
ncbi:uncharacterized protein [Dysidea avara]|uniref:uncharacterized protein isoform X2 n=1 Tax=Dysidea avara TaxID=196820 RepID=UPI003325DD04